MNSIIQEELERFQEARDAFSMGCYFLNCRSMDFTEREFNKATSQFKLALRLFRSIKDKIRCFNKLRSCRWKLAGIVDARGLDIGIWYQNNRITFKEAELMAEVAGRTPSYVRKASKGRGMSVSKTILSLLDEHGINGVTLEMATEEAKKVKPDTKFDKSHLGYYISIWKKKR